MSSLRSNARKPYSRPSNRPNTNERWTHDRYEGHQHNRKNQGLNGGNVAAPTAGAGAPGQATKLKVSNLHYEVTPKDLNAIFGQIGTLVREPVLWYDESGRSTGQAIVTFETAAEATRAMNQFNGILAKGQPMSITYYTPARPPPRRAASAPSVSLLNRIEKPALLDRLAQDDTAAVNKKTPAQAKGGRIGPIRAKATRTTHNKPKKQPKKPKTAEELDKELDAFMGDVEPTQAPTTTAGTGVSAGAPTSAQPAPAAAASAGDVEMA
ncbi:hypothetical protein CC1G_03581 [Coprinopsis cinerea okayama7|uniref:RRM domain-containing protein n=1 Tax=Coprinopsis cinerea (strain Okayama-7 / 130 / ATCC MYA-4618 / FGSC 9003) TaxID=240176 RepID=A8NCM3_COPC7|nr:hypothetical protein CC1G_03581 [Coprinopsis cinerea okayama7\|eukprot:XP_001832567.2 hypothetical protein CC1G_03581 [Coprinopsis cinerea okayama7\